MLNPQLSPSRVNWKEYEVSMCSPMCKTPITNALAERERGVAPRRGDLRDLYSFLISNSPQDEMACSQKPVRPYEGLVFTFPISPILLTRHLWPREVPWSPAPVMDNICYRDNFLSPQAPHVIRLHWFGAEVALEVIPVVFVSFWRRWWENDSQHLGTKTSFNVFLSGLECHMLGLCVLIEMLCTSKG